MRKTRHGSANWNVFQPWATWWDIAVQTNEMLAASAYVINHRTNRMCEAGLTPNGHDIREMTKMITEKSEAAMESAWALSAAFMKMQTDLTRQTWQQALRPPDLSLRQSTDAALSTMQQATHMAQSLSKAAHAGLAPVHSRAVANRKRLSQKRR